MTLKTVPTHIYIAADSRSGSTLLDLLIGNHSQIISVGELRRLNEHYNGHFACTCEAVFNECEFWQAIEDRLNQSNCSLKEMETLIPSSKSVTHDLFYFLPQFILKKLSSRYSWLHRDFKIAANNLTVIDSISQQNKVNFVADSSKVFKLARLFRILSPESNKVIFLIRDGRAV